MTIISYNKNFVYLEKTKNLTKKWNEDKRVQRRQIYQAGKLKFWRFKIGMKSL